ncbi:Rootletin [Paragonimus heterotremus]|uniref:Rootletin n=1 Tax=Paragonimus heterotremus TaxID=100268 RepID=A0A8J4SQL0_9TREM|nr:Rootletin [Paragonimus heterotremus]
MTEKFLSYFHRQTSNDCLLQSYLYISVNQRNSVLFIIQLQTTTENLNNRIEAAESRARTLEQERSFDVEATLSRLQEEQQRVSDLSRANELLRDQLDQAVQANQGLSQDVARLTLAWRHAAQQLDKRETEWREEESAFNDYFAAEHSRLLALWRAVVGLRRQFGDLRQQTDRDLTQARSELVRSTRNIQAVCGNLEINIRANEVQTQANLKRESKYASTLETEAADRVRTITESLTKSQARLAETESKLSEANAAKERLAMQLADRDRILTTMRQLRSGVFQDSLESKTGKKVSKRTKRLHTESETSGEEPTEEMSASEGDDHLKATKQLIEHTHVMHQALSQIAQLVISDSLIADADEAEEPTLSPRHPEWLTGREFERSTDHNIHKPEESAIMRDRTGEEKVNSRPNSPQLDIVESDQLGQKWYGIGQGELSHLRRLIHSKYRAGSSLHLAESTVSAVQTALNRRAAHVHRLRYRTHGLRDQLQNLLKRSDELENERRRANEQLCRLRQEIETQNLELDKVARERDRIKHSLNLTAEEHKLSETTRMTMSEQVRDLKAEIDRHRTIVQDMTKERDDILGEKEKLSTEQDRTLRELASVKAALQNAEDRATSYREELTTIRETLRRAELEKEVLDQEKMDAIGTASKVQARIEDLERKVNQARLQETQCRDKIAQLEATIENHERENQQLNQQNALAHSTELRLTEERSSLRAEKQQLREELDKIYLERGNLNAELEQSREQSLKMETAKNRLEAETSELSQERLALVEALNTAERQKAAMLEDLHALRRDSDRQSNYISRLMSEKESLTKHKAEISIQLTILERDARQQLDQINRLKNEKETLEANLFDAQQLNDKLQNRQTSMEREIAELKLRRETLQAELLRVHTNFQVELDKSQRSQQEIGSQLNTELEELRNALTQAERRAKEAEDACLHAVRRADQAVAVLDRKQKLELESTTDREQDLRKSAEEVNRLTRALLAVQRERDEARMHTEQERHRALLRAADEKACLQERVTLLQQTITDLQKALESSQQECNFKSEQDRITLKKATEEVRVFRNQLEEACTKHEREVRELRIRVRDLEAQRDKLLKESTELQLQARLAEESRNGKRAELTESTSRIRTGIELDRNSAEKRIADLQENVKDAVASASEARQEASELRNKVKKLIFEKDSLDQELNEVKNQMSLMQSKEETLKR